MFGLPFFFEEYVDYNARDEIFIAIEHLSIEFSNLRIQQLFYSIYHHFQHSSTVKLNETNITTKELAIITSKLPAAIAKLRMDLDTLVNFFYTDRPTQYTVFSEEVRMLLSGVVLFRIELLPIFLRSINDETVKKSLDNAPLFLYAHEERLKRETRNFILKGRNMNDEEEGRKMYPASHLWWENKVQFAHTEDFDNLATEYLLED